MTLKSWCCSQYLIKHQSFWKSEVFQGFTNHIDTLVRSDTYFYLNIDQICVWLSVWLLMWFNWELIYDQPEGRLPTHTMPTESALIIRQVTKSVKELALISNKCILHCIAVIKESNSATHRILSLDHPQYCGVLQFFSFNLLTLSGPLCSALWTQQLS